MGSIICVCQQSGEEFVISDEEQSFYRLLGVPLPRLSPVERQRRRIAFRNFKSLSYQQCRTTGKRILSMYDDSVPFPVFDNEQWWGDGWDPLEYGQTIDFSRPFFEQYADLASRVPRFAITNLNTENCNYSNMALNSKNCYFVFGCVENEDCLYGHIVWQCKNCVDGLYLYRCEWCSHSVDLVECYDVHFSQENQRCRESYFLYDCVNCANCFGCFNLRNAQYYFFNEQLSKAAYEEKLREYLPLSHEMIAELSRWLTAEVRGQGVFPAMSGSRCENVTGNHLYECQALHHAFDAKRCESSRYLYTAFRVENSSDISFTSGPARFSLDCLTLANAENTLFSHLITDSSDLAYSEFCFSSRNLFGCIGVRRSENCILNMQYSKSEYEVTRAKLISHMTETGEWGEFFPIALSPFAYNESIVNEYFPLAKDEVLKRGWRWKEVTEIERATPKETESFSICKTTGRSFRITNAEREFCTRMNLPLPELSFNERHARRMNLRLPRELWERRCKGCRKSIMAPYPQSLELSVLCDECYLHRLQDETLR